MSRVLVLAALVLTAAGCGPINDGSGVATGAGTQAGADLETDPGTTTTDGARAPIRALQPAAAGSLPGGVVVRERDAGVHWQLLTEPRDDGTVCLTVAQAGGATSTNCDRRPDEDEPVTFGLGGVGGVMLVAGRTVQDVVTVHLESDHAPPVEATTFEHPGVPERLYGFVVTDPAALEGDVTLVALDGSGDVVVRWRVP